MFTGIITDVGTLVDLSRGEGADTVFKVVSSYNVASLTLGASVSHQGVCLTLVDFEPRPDGCVWTVQVSDETLEVTSAKSWTIGTKVNLERALRLGDELGGHMVSGHVDGIGEVVSVVRENESHRLRIKVPEALAKYIAPKGSIAIDGISLTINEVDNDIFGINVIPHTWDVTTLGSVQVGTLVNLEVDQVARYVERILSRAG